MNDYLQWFDSKPFIMNTIIDNNKNNIEENVLLLMLKLAYFLNTYVEMFSI